MNIHVPIVLNKKYDLFTDNCVYIGRPSKWGNPFVIGPGRTRAQVISQFREYIINSPLMKDIHELDGKDLVCWCSPAACHGDVLLELANKKEE